MLRRILSLVVVLSSFFIAGRVQAQGFPGIDPNDPDIQEMMQMGQQMFQRMQDANIDMADMFQKMQDGSMDPSEMQQMLIDKGVLDKEMINKMQGTMQK